MDCRIKCKEVQERFGGAVLDGVAQTEFGERDLSQDLKEGSVILRQREQSVQGPEVREFLPLGKCQKACETRAGLLVEGRRGYPVISLSVHRKCPEILLKCRC